MEEEDRIMAFSSTVFLLYFLPLAIILYLASAFSKTLQNTVLVALGLFFYAWGQVEYLYLLILTIVVDYLLGLCLQLFAKHQSIRKSIFILGLFANIGLLVGAKYIPFLSSTVNRLSQGVVPIYEWILPIGISFYIFSGISYLIDVYSQKAPVAKNPISLALYFTFFPKLMQGPVMKYRDFFQQDYQRKVTLQEISDGACRFIVGLSKKVIISNQMGIVTDRIFQINRMEEMSLALAWLGIIAYALQIYFDFAGYSDMAIGLAQIFGFNLPENFNYPYISKSISEFWRRWHITLGAFFREYVYFPLGGSRNINLDTIVRNLAVVWILTGLWHGANWTFLMWGMWNFVFIAFERITGFDKMAIAPVWKHLYASLVILLGWVLFRSSSILEAGSYYSAMFNFIRYHLINDYFWLFLREFLLFFILGILFSMPFAPKINKWFKEGIHIRIFASPNKVFPIHYLTEDPRLKWVFDLAYPFAMILLLIVSYIYLVNGSYTSFIYFQF